MRYYYMTIRMATQKNHPYKVAVRRLGGYGQLEPSFIAAKSINWYNHFGELFRQFLLKLNINISFGLTVLTLGIYRSV